MRKPLIIAGLNNEAVISMVRNLILSGYDSADIISFREDAKYFNGCYGIEHVVVIKSEQQKLYNLTQNQIIELTDGIINAKYEVIINTNPFEWAYLIASKIIANKKIGFGFTLSQKKIKTKTYPEIFCGMDRKNPAGFYNQISFYNSILCDIVSEVRDYEPLRIIKQRNTKEAEIHFSSFNYEKNKSIIYEFNKILLEKGFKTKIYNLNVHESLSKIINSEASILITDMAETARFSASLGIETVFICYSPRVAAAGPFGKKSITICAHGGVTAAKNAITSRAWETGNCGAGYYIEKWEGLIDAINPFLFARKKLSSYLSIYGSSVDVTRIFTDAKKRNCDTANELVFFSEIIKTNVMGNDFLRGGVE